jgi:CRISPR-associated protein Cmr5
MSEALRKKVEQGRASETFKRVKEFVDANISSAEGKKKLDEYKSYSKKFPMMVKTSGLGAALAFTFSKGKDAHKRLMDDLIHCIGQSITCQESFKKQVLSENNADIKRKKLLEYVLNLPSLDYRYLTSEVFAIMNWHRRFTEGLIPKSS